MYIKFEDVQAVDDSYIPEKEKKCSKNFIQKEITHRHTALCIISTNTNTKFQVRLEMTKLRSRLRTILKNFLIQRQITPVVLV